MFEILTIIRKMLPQFHSKYIKTLKTVSHDVSERDFTIVGNQQIFVTQTAIPRNYKINIRLYQILPSASLIQLVYLTNI